MVIFSLQIFLVSIAAGMLGSILGLGGGIIIIPVLTLIYKVDIEYAIGASIVAVIATSSGAAVAYIRDKVTNIRIGMFLEIATTTGAVTGAFVGGILDSKYLFIIFSLLMLYSTIMMLKKTNSELPHNTIQDPLANKLKLHGEYYDKSLKEDVKYNVSGVKSSFGVMYFAGIMSGLLGIGSGSFKVMAMDVFMKLPMKVSSSTSNFMIGVTAAASAGVYLLRGDIRPDIAGPVALGVLVGATAGAKIMQHLKNKTIRMIFIPVLFYVAVQMFMRGIGA